MLRWLEKLTNVALGSRKRPNLVFILKDEAKSITKSLRPIKLSSFLKKTEKIINKYVIVQYRIMKLQLACLLKRGIHRDSAAMHKELALAKFFDVESASDKGPTIYVRSLRLKVC